MVGCVPQRLPALDKLDSQPVHYKLSRTDHDEAQQVPVVEAGVSVLNGAIMDRDSRVAVVVREDTPVRRANSVDERSSQAGAVRTGEVLSGPLQIRGSMAPVNGARKESDEPLGSSPLSLSQWLRSACL